MEKFDEKFKNACEEIGGKVKEGRILNCKTDYGDLSVNERRFGNSSIDLNTSPEELEDEPPGELQNGVHVEIRTPNELDVTVLENSILSLNDEKNHSIRLHGEKGLW